MAVKLVRRKDNRYLLGGRMPAITCHYYRAEKTRRTDQLVQCECGHVICETSLLTSQRNTTSAPFGTNTRLRRGRSRGVDDNGPDFFEKSLEL